MGRHFHSRKGPLAALVLAAATVAPTGAALAGTAGASAGDAPSGPRVQADFNGDDLPDLAVGVPGESVGAVAEAGVVNVLYSTAGTGLGGTGSQMFSQDTDGVGSTAEQFDHFGAAVAVGDFNADGFDDLAVGAPDEAVGSLLSAGAILNAGRASQLLTQDTNGVSSDPEPFDGLGVALATADFNGDGPADLVLGVPGERVGTVPAAGAINVLPGTTAGLTGTGSQVFHQGVAGIGSDPETADFFGMALGVAAS